MHFEVGMLTGFVRIVEVRPWSKLSSWNTWDHVHEWQARREEERGASKTEKGFKQRSESKTEGALTGLLGH